MMTFIALLRGINVSGHNKIPMAELCALCAELGWADVRSYIQSGNLLFQADGPATALENDLEQAIMRQFNLAIPVIMRTAANWSAYVSGNPLPQASVDEPNRVMLALAKSPPRQDALEKLQERATSTEHIMQIDDALWIHFGEGVGQSKLTPTLLDRFVGSPVTMRNWRTVLKLDEMRRQL